tara:strand:+ start:1208 stop:1639 length:432 start_codon:yes stop_codon:yes gene_type:complete
MKDWINIIQEFELVAAANPFIKKFGYGRRDSKQELFDAWDKEFPILWINSDSFNYNKGSFIYSVDTDVFSIIKDSQEDADKTISDCNAIIIDVINQMYNKDLLTNDNVTITPYHWQEDTGEIVAGVTATIEIEVGNNNANCNY